MLGFVDALRKKVWPVIAQSNGILERSSSEKIKHHHYYNQVVLDVKRILKRFPPGNRKEFLLFLLW